MKAKKKFGQNFLVDRYFISKIINEINPKEESNTELDINIVEVKEEENYEDGLLYMSDQEIIYELESNDIPIKLEKYNNLDEEIRYKFLMDFLERNKYTSELKNKIRFLVYMCGMPKFGENNGDDSPILGHGIGVFDRPVFKDGLLPFTCGSLELLRESGIDAAGKRGKELMFSYNKALQMLPGDARYWPHILMTEAVL